MPGKRSRASKSQSFGDVTLLGRRPSPELRCETGAVSQEESRSQSPQASQIVSFCTAAPIVKGCDNGDGNEEKGEHFLERCHLCKKRLKQSSDIYMYGYLRAFCSTDCRDIQIAIEKEAQKVLG